MSKVVNPICPDCSNQCPCTLLETIGKTCTDVRNVIEDGEFAAMQFNTDCGVELVNIQKEITDIVNNTTITIPISSDLNGYTGDGSSLQFDTNTKTLYYDQEIIRRKFPKQIIAEITVNPFAQNYDPSVRIITTQNITKFDFELSVVGFNSQIDGYNFPYLEVRVNDINNKWNNLPTSITIVETNNYFIKTDGIIGLFGLNYYSISIVDMPVRSTTNTITPNAWHILLCNNPPIVYEAQKNKSGILSLFSSNNGLGISNRTPVYVANSIRAYSRPTNPNVYFTQTNEIKFNVIIQQAY